MALGRLPLGPLLPNVVTYRGYSLCMEHMQLWEGCRREDGAPAEWEDVMSFARPKPTETGERLDRAWEAAPADVEELHLYKDKAVAILPGGKEVEVMIATPETETFDLLEMSDHPDDVLELKHAGIVEPEFDPGEPLVEKGVMGLTPSRPKKRRRRGKTYYCTKCDKKHSRKSDIGKEHKEFST